MPATCVPLADPCLKIRMESRRSRKVLPPWRILAPIHPRESPETLAGLEVVAGTLKAELTTLTVIGGSPDGRRDGDDPMSDIVLHGDPVSRIRHYSSFMHPDLIVMPSRLARLPFHFWRRSVTADVLRRTDRPVMVVPAGVNWPAFPRVQEVLCVVQLDGGDQAVLQRAAALADRWDCGVTLLHVLPEVNEGTLLACLDGSNTPLSARAATARMHRLSVRGRLHGSEVRTGPLHKTIGSFAQRIHAGVVVTRRDIRKRNFPSVRSLQRRVGCPVLSVAPASYDLMLAPSPPPRVAR